MQKKHILKALSLLAAVCITAGCGESKNSLASTVDNITSRSTAPVDTNAIPKEASKDLLLKELENGIEMNDVKFSIPFTIEDLGQDYYATGSNVEYDIFYKDKYYAFVTVDESDDFLKSYVKSIQYTSDTDFKLGELYCGNTKESVLAAYGEADLKSPSGIMEHYLFDNGVVFGIEYDNNKIVSLGITFSV